MTDVNYYMVSLDVTPAGEMMPGAPSLTLKLGVNATNGEINGTATVTQALPPPNGERAFPVSGTMHHTGLGTDTLLVSLTGHCVESVPPPAIGSYLVPFSAALAVPKNCAGTGSYSLRSLSMSHCNVTRTSA